MFEKASIMVMLGKRTDIRICRLETDKSTQTAVCKSFSNYYQNLTVDKQVIKFDGSYKPEDDEILYIDSFGIDKQILEAIKEPSGVPPFIPTLEETENIVAVFVGKSEGEDTRIAFQKFRKEQYISTRGFNIFFDKETFIQDNRYGITIADGIDCVWVNNQLQFHSYFITNQIFDLQDYYRTATEKEVDDFTKQTIICFEDPEVFRKQASGSRMRKVIAEIMDSKVLKTYTASEIKKMAKQQTGVELEVKNKQLVMPQEKEKVKIFFGVLTEGVYKGIFSKATYIANSKRAVKK